MPGGVTLEDRVAFGTVAAKGLGETVSRCLTASPLFVVFTTALQPHGVDDGDGQSDNPEAEAGPPDP